MKLLADWRRNYRMVIAVLVDRWINRLSVNLSGPGDELMEKWKWIYQECCWFGQQSPLIPNFINKSNGTAEILIICFTRNISEYSSKFFLKQISIPFFYLGNRPLHVPVTVCINSAWSGGQIPDNKYLNTSLPPIWADSQLRTQPPPVGTYLRATSATPPPFSVDRRWWLLNNRSHTNPPPVQRVWHEYFNDSISETHSSHSESDVRPRNGSSQKTVGRLSDLSIAGCWLIVRPNS